MHNAILDSRVLQTHHANRHRQLGYQTRDSDERDTLEVEGFTYLSTKNLTLFKGHARKLLLQFLGLYKIVKASPETSTYTLELPDELKKRRIYSKFHTNLLRWH